MNTTRSKSSSEVARDYYNSSDADLFYAEVWGGEDIHVGIYRNSEESIAAASRRTIAEMLAKIMARMTSEVRILDIGSGYGGAARFLAHKLGCRVVGLNLSEVENERARFLNRASGFGHEIEIVDGSFEEMPFPKNSFDVVWSQDAILHSGQRRQVFSEVTRVLRPRGDFIFTDPMQAPDCPQEALGPIFERICLRSLGSPRDYRAYANAVGLQEQSYDNLTSHFLTHYTRVLQESEHRTKELEYKISPAYLSSMKEGLQHWIKGAEKGHLCWGIFHFCCV